MEKTLNKKQKLSVILSREQSSLRTRPVYCLHSVTDEIQS